MSIQIPNLHTSNRNKAKFDAVVRIARRQDAVHSGVFRVRGSFSFDPATTDYPACSLSIDVDLSDSIKGTFVSKDVQQLDTTGKHTPTLFASGKCTLDGEDSRQFRGCRYWLLLADNTRSPRDGAPDVVSFPIFDRTGKRVAYGTGPVEKGDIVIQPTAE